MDSGKTEPLKKTPEEEFLNFAQLSFADRMRAQILGDLGLDEETLASVDAETREKIEEKIRETIEKKIREETGVAVGGIADLSA